LAIDVYSPADRFYATALPLANFVGFVVSFLNVLEIRLRSLLLAASLSFEIEVALNIREYTLND
jgi:hypothetical protein